MSKDQITMEIPCIELDDENLSAVLGGKFDFLKIDGIKGESTDAGHKDWIEMLNFRH
jgi:hypothetical protein